MFYPLVFPLSVSNCSGIPIKFPIILEYLSRTNRPFNIIQIVGNIRNDNVKRKDTQRVLDASVKDKKIVMKMYGKAKVYLYNQDLKPEVSKVELEQATTKEDRLRREFQALKVKVKDTEK